MAALKRCLLAFLVAGAYARQAPPVPPQTYPVPAAKDESGYELIFDGKTLNGLGGRPKYWRVEDGSLVGEITPETLIKSNTFIIWRGGVTQGLRAEGGVPDLGERQQRHQLPQRRSAQDAAQFAMRGYQADIDGRNRYTGQNYEEKRPPLHRHARPDHPHCARQEGRGAFGTLGEPNDLATFIKNDDWNELPPDRARQHADAYSQRPPDERGDRR